MNKFSENRPFNCTLTNYHINNLNIQLSRIHREGNMFVIKSNFPELNIKARTRGDAIDQFEEHLKKELLDNPESLEHILENLFKNESSL